nr:MAG TPA: hypothetical protein [Caudoviricetes sp.]DAT33056.1 MAG TPA: hypothetical protein [Caudoviricetes sp.]
MRFQNVTGRFEPPITRLGSFRPLRLKLHNSCDY